MKLGRDSRITITLVLLLIAASVSTCGKSKLTMANYGKIATGMSPAEVEAILGPGKEQASSGMEIPSQNVAGVTVPGASVSGKVVVWQEGQKMITVTYVNEKVATKAQFGLS
jgi:hypothetical protein